MAQEVAPKQSPKGPKPLTSEALICEALLWRFGSSLDLKRAHNPKVTLSFTQTSPRIGSHRSATIEVVPALAGEPHMTLSAEIITE